MRSVVVLAITSVLVPAPCPAQQTPQPLSLDGALALAEARSEQIAIAQAGVARARAEESRVRSERFPQLDLSASYNRTLATEFKGLFDGAAPGNGSNDGDGQDVDLGQLPFGRKNIWRVDLQLSQSLFTAGRVGAQERIARIGSVTAGIDLASARAQLTLDVVRAYYDAMLSERLFAIAGAAYQQADVAYQQTRLGREAGTQPEFELLRAQVARDNQRPIIIRRRSERDLAHLRLKQLLELPPDQPIELTTPLDEPALPVPAAFAPALTEAEARIRQTARAPVRQAESLVRVREAAVDVTRSQRFPSVSLTSSYGRVTYPADVLPELDNFRTNWTVGVVAQIPILTGGRVRAEERIARADAEQAEARLQRARELAELDTQSALEELEAAEAAWEASAGTVQQAARAYEIADLRYRQGISTQLELTDARLLLEQAGANRAQAARDLQVARVRVALLPDLPLDTATGVTITAPAPTQTPQTPAGVRQTTPGVRAAQATSGGIQP